MNVFLILLETCAHPVGGVMVKVMNPKDETGWVQAQYVAGNIMYNGKYRGITEGATHYHATYVKPQMAF